MPRSSDRGGEELESRQGSALKSARRRCYLNLRQRARPFAIYPWSLCRRRGERDVVSAPLLNKLQSHGSKETLGGVPAEISG